MRVEGQRADFRGHDVFQNLVQKISPSLYTYLLFQYLYMFSDQLDWHLLKVPRQYMIPYI